MSDSRHSAAYFNDQRDFWWNADYVAHLAEHWGLRQTHRLLDLGCGVGHWGRLLAPHLASDAEVVGLDREASWAAEAARRFGSTPRSQTGRFLCGDAHHLPFPDGHFDAATCQTVLMHLRDPLRALREMARVVKPGGWVIAAEPNNLIGCLAFDERTHEQPVEELTALFEFWVRYMRGKERLDQGDNSLGERLPGLFLDAGLEAIDVRQNDHPQPIFPPYDRPEQRANLASIEEWKRTGSGSWDFEDLRVKYLAGGGDAASFERAANLLRRRHDEQVRGVEARTYREVGSSLFFLARGRKPA
jgi:ubiquinone/menaquinone biosynthesis C-methylase UbiE